MEAQKWNGNDQHVRERSLIIGGGGLVNLGGGPGFFGLPFGEGHMFLSLR